MKKKINESTGTLGSPGTKGYTGYLPSEKYAKYRSELARIIKKTTGYDLVDLEPITDDTIDKSDNEINNDDVNDVNIASTKRHKELEKDFNKMNESVEKKVTIKEVTRWLKGLEEYRYRKIPGVDARRITSFINNGLVLYLCQLNVYIGNDFFKRYLAPVPPLALRALVPLERLQCRHQPELPHLGQLHPRRKRHLFHPHP